jgi:O-glycosyl hydrolase
VYWQLTNPFDAGKESLCVDGTPTPKYYAVKHFARFVRPGAVRVAATPDSPGLGVSAFVQKKDKTLTAVLINAGDTERRIKVNATAPWAITSFEVHRSSTLGMCKKLDAVPSTEAVTLPARSITTLVSKG